MNSFSDYIVMGAIKNCDLFLFNSLSGKKELFRPIDDNNVRMYVCGPTVYDYAHLGNIRSAVVYDVLFRLLSYIYPKVVYARNITDVDDKILNRMKEENRGFAELTEYMSQCYHEDLDAVNCLSPQYEPRATSYIGDMIALISKLISSGYAYVAEKHVLFDISKYKDYGSLSKRSSKDIMMGARVEVAPFKRHPSDFVLWKPVSEEDITCFNDKPSLWNNGIGGVNKVGVPLYFDSPWGLGRPGWHIECSAMSYVKIGIPFDIHGGGGDLIFPHHENEIAQSRCAFGVGKYANYWVHNGFIIMKGDKMSKTGGNFITFRDAVNDPFLAELSSYRLRCLVLRYFYLTGHYRKPLTYHQDAIESAFGSIKKISTALIKRKNVVMEIADAFDAKDYFYQDVMSSICDDMNVSKVLSILHKSIDNLNDATENESYGIIRKILFIFHLTGLNIFDLMEFAFYNRSDGGGNKREEISEYVLELLEKRLQAKKERNWPLADLLREEIRSLGYDIKDGKTGSEVVRITDVNLNKKEKNCSK